MQPNTLTGRGYEGKIYVKKHSKKFMLDPKKSFRIHPQHLFYVIFCLKRGEGGCIGYLDGGRSPGLGPPLLHKGGVRLRLRVLHQERLVLTKQKTESDRANLLTNQQSESDIANLLTDQRSELIPLKLVLRIRIRINFGKPVTDPHQSEKPDPDLHRS
jgi:hypothetical protein